MQVLWCTLVDELNTIPLYGKYQHCLTNYQGLCNPPPKEGMFFITLDIISTTLHNKSLGLFLNFVLYLSESMVPYVEETDRQYGYQSDHSMFVLKFSFGKETTRKTFWKCYSFLLKDSAYLIEINEEIKVVEEYSVVLYNRKELHNIPKFDTRLTIADRLFLDVLLMKIRSKQLDMLQWRNAIH